MTCDLLPMIAQPGMPPGFLVSRTSSDVYFIYIFTVRQSGIFPIRLKTTLESAAQNGENKPRP